MGSDLDKLKMNAESILDRDSKDAGVLGGNLLEDISEEDIPEADIEDGKDLNYQDKLSPNLTTIKEDDGEEGLAGGTRFAAT